MRCIIHTALLALGLTLCAFSSEAAPWVTSSISPNGSTTCALTTAGGVKCWGLNDHGQLGDNTTTNRYVAGDVTGLTSGVVAIATGASHACALTTAGGVMCWGANNQGQLGDTTTNDSLAPVAVPDLISGTVAIAAGSNHTCALTRAGGVKCWGYNASGQLGNNSAVDSHVPVDVVGFTANVVAIATGSHHSCALTAVGAVKCWGLNDHGQLGDNSTTNSPAPVNVSSLASGAASIATTDNHTCALTSAGAVLCWGANNNGQLGDNTLVDKSTPVAVNGLGTGVASIAAGSGHSCALTTAAAMKCWGKNDVGQLGDTTTTNKLIPVNVNGMASGVSAIRAGGRITCALSANNSTTCWGDNQYGSLGDGTTSHKSTPTPVTGLNDAQVNQLTLGYRHTCALNKGGTVQCWGLNDKGQLGDNSTTNKLVPAAVGNLTEAVTSLSAGSDHTCALTAAGGVKCWGNNTSGQLGDQTYTQRTLPVGVFGLDSGVAAVESGGNHTCAVTTAGAAHCWGQNGSGQVGNNGGSSIFSSPVPVTGLGSGVRTISAGYHHTCALTTAGAVKCWGGNTNGQIGDGTTTARTAPTAVIGLGSGVAAISAGYYHTCALLTSGAVKCWGQNFEAQLGDNSLTNRPILVDAVGLASGVSAIAAGSYNTCARMTTGSVKCWGDSGPRVPTDVSGLANVTGIASGSFFSCAVIGTGNTLCWGNNQSGQLGNNSTTSSDTPVTTRLGPQSITFSPATSVAFGSNYSLAATATSGLAASFDTWTTATCSIVGQTLTPVSVGLCAVRASQAGDAGFFPASQQIRLIQITQAAQAITFNQPTSQTYGAAPYTLIATGGASGNAIVFTSTTLDVCTITTTGTVTIIGAGSCRIETNQAGNTLYLPATTVARTFTVNKKSQLIAFAQPAAVTFSATPFALTATGGGSGNPVTFTSTTPVVCTVTLDGTVTTTGAGNCTINTNQAGNANYLAASQVSRTFVVNKASQSITFAQPANVNFGVAPFQLTASGGASGNPVTFISNTATVCTVTLGGTVTTISAGNCSITANQTGNTNYLAASQVSRTFTVNKAAQAIAITIPAPLSAEYNTVFTVGASASSGLPVTVSVTGSCSGSAGSVTMNIPGNACVVHYSQAGDANYLMAPELTSTTLLIETSLPLEGLYKGAVIRDINTLQ